MLITLLKNELQITPHVLLLNSLLRKIKAGSVSTIRNFLLQKPGATTLHSIY